MACRFITCSIAALLALGACSDKSEDPEPNGGDDTGDVDQEWWDTWYYLHRVRDGTSYRQMRPEPDAPDAVADQVVRIDGYRWSGFLGPALVMEQEQQLNWQVRNDSSHDLQFELGGVEPIDVPVVEAGDAKWLIVRSTPGPGVHFYRAFSPDDQHARRGIVGLVTVRDTCEWEPRDIEEQGAIILMETWPEATSINARVVPELAVDGADGCEDPPDPEDPEDEVTVEPCWKPMVSGTHTMGFGQQINVALGWDLSQAPPSIADCDDEGNLRGWLPVDAPLQAEDEGGLRHGGQNEFITTSTTSLLIFDEGITGRLNLASMSQDPHKLSLDGLTYRRPGTDEIVPAEDVVLEPGQGVHLLWEWAAPGLYTARCIEHDHHGLDEVLIWVRPAAD